MFGTVLGYILSNILFLALHLESRVLPDPLTPKQEKEEFEKYFNGDLKARDKLIKHNLRLVAHVVKKYYGGPIENDDLMSIGTIGLIKSVQSFNFGRNTRFSTYSARCIENEVLMAMRKLKSTENTVYLEESIDAENQNSKLTLKDSLQDDFEISEYCEARQQKDDVLKLVLQKLDARQRQIIIMRYGLFGNPQQTQQQVCEILGISRSYVSRLEKRAVEILRQELLAGDE
ncbi:MAG: sigma-70 family RNA polymerase sigma factor [Oscillospiraceae bacterium]|nr:sigma-70 family RNA polymerase sigma factor [Oscillospiraceae bacterium]MBQ6930130.1 sigma-70 family RNA polymerase sigma factor [Oscillospiraceae bacterium]